MEAVNLWLNFKNYIHMFGLSCINGRERRTLRRVNGREKQEDGAEKERVMGEGEGGRRGGRKEEKLVHSGYIIIIINILGTA